MEETMSTQHNEIEEVVVKLEEYIATNSNTIPHPEKSLKLLFGSNTHRLMSTRTKERFLLAYSLANSNLELNERQQTLTKFLESMFLAQLLVTKTDKDNHSLFFDEEHQYLFTQVLFYLAEELAVMNKQEKGIINSFFNGRTFLKKNFKYLYNVILNRSGLPLDSIATGEWINEPFVLHSLYGDNASKQSPLPVNYAT